MLGNRKAVWAVLGVSAAVAFAAVAYPMYVIRPFRAQGASELMLALAVRAWGPAVAVVCGVLAVAAAALLWRGERRALRRVALAGGAVLSVAFAGLAHVNVFELMFHPIEKPQAAPAASAKVDGDDAVLAIQAGGQARAYPIRMMAYHHIVNDWVGDVPVAATY